MDFLGMTDAQLDRAVERHWDREWERRFGGTDAWDRCPPDAETIIDLVNDTWAESKIADAVRDFIDRDGTLFEAMYWAGLFKGYAQPVIDEKDPDAVFAEVDRVLEENWRDDALMLRIWEWLPDERLQELAAGLAENAGYNGLRQAYNKKEGY